jgi:DNA topoisomerase-1
MAAAPTVLASSLPDPAAPQIAAAAGLRYVSDARPGIRRVGSGRGFRYVAPDGSAVRDAETLARIRSLAIPPAYRDVWICPDPRGHIQATGRDARQRKQYRYHPAWRQIRDSVKYDRMIAFAEALPRIREQAYRDLELPGLPQRKVLAAIVRLLESTRIRIGNEEYTRQNRSFGLTTLRNRHVQVIGATVRFRFKGKSGKEHNVRITDRKLARVVEGCMDIPGCELFEYLDHEGDAHVVDSGEVNDYLRELAGGEFSAKDFRTWSGTVAAVQFLADCSPCRSEREAKRQIGAALTSVAGQLGNTPAVCRKAYVHPVVLDAYRSGTLHRSARRQRKGPKRSPLPESSEAVCALSQVEELTLHVLRAATERAPRGRRLRRAA